jgi:hypothetical protein
MHEESIPLPQYARRLGTDQTKDKVDKGLETSPGLRSQGLEFSINEKIAASKNRA